MRLPVPKCTCTWRCRRIDSDDDLVRFGNEGPNVPREFLRLGIVRRDDEPPVERRGAENRAKLRHVFRREDMTLVSNLQGAGPGDAREGDHRQGERERSECEDSQAG